MNPIELAVFVGERLDALGVDWVVGGSLASSLSGEPRSTLDVDIAISIHGLHAGRLHAAFESQFYVDLGAVRHAFETKDSFNLIEPNSGYKVDIFVLGDGALDRLQIARRQWVDELGLWVTSAEDILVRKLWWYDRSGRVSERQWADVLGILRTQGPTLDRTGVIDTARMVDLEALAERAFEEADR